MVKKDFLSSENPPYVMQVDIIYSVPLFHTLDRRRRNIGQATSI